MIDLDQEAKAQTEAKAEETTQVGEDGPRPTEAEVTEADQLEGQSNKICDECRRKETGKLQKRNCKTIRILCGPILADLAKRGQILLDATEVIIFHCNGVVINL